MSKAAFHHVTHEYATTSYLFKLKLKLQGWNCEHRVVVERTLKPLNPSPQGSFWQQCEQNFNDYVATLTPQEAGAFQVIHTLPPARVSVHPKECIRIPFGCSDRITLRAV